MGAETQEKFTWTFCTADINDPNDKEIKSSAFSYSKDPKKSVAFSDATFSVDKPNDTTGLYPGFLFTYESKTKEEGCAENTKVIFHINCKED